MCPILSPGQHFLHRKARKAGVTGRNAQSLPRGWSLTDGGLGGWTARPGANSRLGRQLAWIGRLAQAGLAEAYTGAIVEQDAVLFAGPDGISLEQSGPLNLKEHAARLALAQDHGLVQRRLL